ncbi:keto-deoxy-phosphogluconate aldolase [Gilliamella sp. Fer2-1]|jgi:2-dehydro-3-deoxyphosphogluconate aldolase / (4S)-4-hydroxy-2-oxoglutarate aldolase|uniref:bifunctional 4-hydroxy-2-oxoglutarate aldolase/2-dehydro-3-deoxy-phosphogluconate aldolase n=2 Tax=unclassified Gilliamella TaxID=2685620 RepID=UPI00080DD4B2|nr:bifunctional 4-hydroxy-2-oxoglutarate aldolase/2-dehydro-3-deoxy-phosphogluconate aldolase [Gilliamella apicola]OCG15701.1 keto-deoxy-phosphogluconate aldolase [Gilliamella apicola]OCG38697.1 keto-deoxy-phosphogluconate aldolase [Gilliamella apicola]OCG60949.1 keto-deoxy-phosphogluconate aldolase [Gilliamella apicola]OCG68765.1 keto-deoxy-phosphogluconate aldolase [Gilliamella apicola]OCG74114.1 keto-deoxy-phosphogluconate aldolase [Gilliamella apicola]
MKNWKRSAEEILTLGPVIPVIVIERLEDAVPLAKALIAGGVKVLEVTLRTACAIDAIKKIIQEVPEAVVGAGTVTSVAQLKQVTEAGVQFVITPGITDAILKAAVEGSVPVIPGIATISELLTAQEYGLTALKFFPAEVNGGVAALKAFAGPCGYMKFCPTGGVNPKNYRDYLALDNVLCVGGTWFIPTDAIAKGDFAKITEMAKQAVADAQCC